MTELELESKIVRKAPLGHPGTDAYPGEAESYIIDYQCLLGDITFIRFETNN